MFAGHVLAFDLSGTQTYVEIIAKTQQAGLAITIADRFIAATSAANGFVLAARDTSPFEPADAKNINPWAS